MGYDAILRSGIKIIDRQTQSLQPFVIYYAWLGQNEYGEPKYANPVSYRAIVDTTVRERRTSSGQIVSVKAKVFFPRPVPATTITYKAYQYPGFEAQKFEEQAILESPSAFQAFDFQNPPFDQQAFVFRQNPIDPRDKIVLPDGTTGPIVDVSGFVDQSTNLPYFSDVSLGA